ncbi:hypothetical protein B005_1810 [Nocardiopsis alba ATCC BAA-2165]|uniref:Uncharacterized protein n=1 Tax=Nocardiopsis alba (strain ATCC BAA-2165 / BE74) TaxID=1205910 RepID=J7LBF3_NOCAA|nr:hypothetical protein B005_1810 [Nocardiopsis alba ATCC BAA-2165]
MPEPPGGGYDDAVRHHDATGIEEAHGGERSVSDDAVTHRDALEKPDKRGRWIPLQPVSPARTPAKREDDHAFRRPLERNSNFPEPGDSGKAS